MDSNKMWMVFVGLAGLCWGTYVPFIAAGGKELKNSYAAFLCVGVVYFLIAVLFPISILWARGVLPQFTARGTAFASLAGIAGALGALCVIFATVEWKGPRLYVGPVIFALAPVINTIFSLFWHPTTESPFHFGPPVDLPSWKFYVGILLAGLGAALVLYSKEEVEEKHKVSATPPAAVTMAEPK